MLDWQFHPSGPDKKELDMNRDSVEGNWEQFKGKVKACWGNLSDDHRDAAAGKCVELTDMLHEPSPEETCVPEVEIPPRRVVLQGALALGCSLFLPIALSGCDARKGASSTSAAPASPAAGTEPAAPATSGKMTQASVQYQAQPKGEEKCAGCMHFIAGSNTCKLVDGQISPEGWCSLWAKKA
jgi:hypothetical protein